MAHIRCDCYDFHYQLIGADDGPVILFLHGFMGNCHGFDQVLPYLCDRYRCLIVDLPGHGHTKVEGSEKCYAMEPTAVALLELVTRLQLKQCILLGYSMGGRLALYLGLYFPNYFTKLILESASPGLRTQAEREQRLQQDLQLAHQLETIHLEAFLEQWYNNPLFASLRHHLEFDGLLQQRLTNRPLALANSLRQMSTGRQPSLWPRLPTAQLPTLLLVGELDQKFLQINTEIQLICQSATLTTVQQCGHNIHFEQPRVFASLVWAFLAESEI